MLLPLVGWCVTGFVFFIKPGYEGAYELLQPKTYPLDGPLAITPDPSWLELRYLKTIIGNHLLVRTAQGWLALPLAPPSLATNQKLVQAFRHLGRIDGKNLWAIGAAWLCPSGAVEGAGGGSVGPIRDSTGRTPTSSSFAHG